MPNGEQALEEAQEGEDSAEDSDEWDSQEDDKEEAGGLDWPLGRQVKPGWFSLSLLCFLFSFVQFVLGLVLTPNHFIKS